MNPEVEAARNLVVDLGAEPGQAAEGRLNMSARAAEAIIEIEMAEGGIEIVDPHQADHATAEPDAFGVARRAIDDLGGLGKFGSLALVFLRRIGGCRRIPLGCVLGMVVAALGQSATDKAATNEAATTQKQENHRAAREMAQKRNLEWKHWPTHKFPDLLPRFT